MMSSKTGPHHWASVVARQVGGRRGGSSAPIGGVAPEGGTMIPRWHLRLILALIA